VFTAVHNGSKWTWRISEDLEVLSIPYGEHGRIVKKPKRWVCKKGKDILN